MTALAITNDTKVNESIGSLVNGLKQLIDDPGLAPAVRDEIIDGLKALDLLVWDWIEGDPFDHDHDDSSSTYIAGRRLARDESLMADRAKAHRDAP